MQFNTGNPSLVSLAARLAGENSAAVGNLFPLQEVKDAVNLAYEELWDRAIDSDPAFGRKEAFITSVTDQILYTNPSDLGGQVISVAIEKDGKDLSSDTTADWTYLIPTEHENEVREYRLGNIDEPEFFYLEIVDGSDKFGIIAPPATGGTNSISMVYQASYTALSADADVPLLPEAYHKLISYIAADMLRSERDMESLEVKTQINRLYPAFLARVTRVSPNLHHRMDVVGSNRTNYQTVSGFTKRI